MTVALIISTYNRPEALRLCLESALKQKLMPDEIIIGDDGSADSTREVIEDFSKRCPVPVKHIWHPDEGFRLAAIRNKSVAATDCDYIIQIDGDIVMHPMFVADHKSAALPGYFVKGSRIRLTPEYTSQACESGRFEIPSVFSRAILKDRLKAVRIPFCGPSLSHRYKVDSKSGIGCNMAFWRNDFMAVNGYDEFFEGWGGEDIDLCARLTRYGNHNFKLFRIGLCYHLWHRESVNPNISKSLEHIERGAAAGVIGCTDGVSKYINQD